MEDGEEVTVILLVKGFVIVDGSEDDTLPCSQIKVVLDECEELYE